MTQNPIAVSTWSLHHLLERIPFEALPSELAGRGFQRVEICHFHLANQEPNYLRGVANEFQAHGVTIQTLLIDAGDITNHTCRDKDLNWIKQWIDVAVLLGAENARVVAGKSLPTDDALQTSVAGLRELVAYGTAKGVRIVTENWFALLSTPQAVRHVLDAVGPELGFMADTGNWHGATKYVDLQSIFARATLCHAKASFDENQVMDELDFGACLAAARASHYKGPLTLIFDAAGDEWAGLEKIRNFIARF